MGGIKINEKKEVHVNFSFSLQDMALVDLCPNNSTTVTEASKSLGCGHDEYGNSQYLCLPNANLSSLVEFCYDGIMGLQDKGKVLILFHQSYFVY